MKTVPQYVVGGVYEGIGECLWTITHIDPPGNGLRWLIATGEGGGSVQIFYDDAPKWFHTQIGHADDKVFSLDDARQQLRDTLKARDRLNRLISRQAKAVEQ